MCGIIIPLIVHWSRLPTGVTNPCIAIFGSVLSCVILSWRCVLTYGLLFKTNTLVSPGYFNVIPEVSYVRPVLPRNDASSRALFTQGWQLGATGTSYRAFRTFRRPEPDLHANDNTHRDHERSKCMLAFRFGHGLSRRPFRLPGVFS